MQTIPVIAIFDVGKTNKKVFLFDEKYNKLFEETVQLNETIDEDGDVCEDLTALTEWVRSSFQMLLNLSEFQIKAVNFSAYGASFVHIMKEGASLLPLYNYLKPYPKALQDEFYNTYGGENKMSKETASPVSGSLNSGLQLYRIKKEKPEVFKKIITSLHLPQYLSFLITNNTFSDITSIGCHTSLWDFQKNEYHHWVFEEGIYNKLAPVKQGDETVEKIYNEKKIIVGIGLHDSSSALIPYLLNFKEPFVLISTGTWSISLNPFNNSILTEEELKKDSLCYLQFKGLPVKANRLFAGYEHENQIKNLSSHFMKPIDFFKNIYYDSSIIEKLKIEQSKIMEDQNFPSLDLTNFKTYEEAYHQLIMNIIRKQIDSTKNVLNETKVTRIFVDGGFSKNDVYMHLLANAFPEMEVYAASMAQATAMGAALAIHHKWNSNVMPSDLIQLKLYSISNPII